MGLRTPLVRGSSRLSNPSPPSKSGLGETQVVDVPARDGVLASTFLSGALSGSGEWRFGSVQVASAIQIGAEYGLSGRIHRVTVETERGGSLSIVVKQESAVAVERELLFRGHCGELVRSCIPDLFCGMADDESGRGVLVLEDIAPAEQGDVLQGCTGDQAEAVVRVLARLHGNSRSATGDPDQAGLPRWRARPMEREQWHDRLDRARERFPEILAPHAALLLDAREGRGRGQCAQRRSGLMASGRCTSRQHALSTGRHGCIARLV